MGPSSSYSLRNGFGFDASVSSLIDNIMYRANNKVEMMKTLLIMSERIVKDGLLLTGFFFIFSLDGIFGSFFSVFFTVSTPFFEEGVLFPR